MIDLPLNILIVVLSFLTTDEILEYSFLSHQVIKQFQDNETLWETALISQPIGYRRDDELNEALGVRKLNLTKTRQSCIDLLKIYDCCIRTSSIQLLLSTLRCYTTCHDLCLYIYSRILVLSLTKAMFNDYKTRSQIYISFVNEFTLFRQDSTRLIAALRTYSNLLRFHQINNGGDFTILNNNVLAITDTIGIEPNESIGITTGTWVQQSSQIDVVHDRDDSKMSLILITIIKDHEGFTKSLNEIKNEKESSIDYMNLTVLQMAIRTCINLSISPVQAKIMQQNNITRLILDILYDNQTQFQFYNTYDDCMNNGECNKSHVVDMKSSQQTNMIKHDDNTFINSSKTEAYWNERNIDNGSKLRSCVDLSLLGIYLLMNVTDKRNVEYEIMQEIFQTFTEVSQMLLILAYTTDSSSRSSSSSSSDNNIIDNVNGIVHSNHLFLPEALKIIDFLLSLCLWQRVYLQSPVVVESVKKLYTIIISFEHSVYSSSRNGDTDNYANQSSSSSSQCRNIDTMSNGSDMNHARMDWQYSNNSSGSSTDSGCSSNGNSSNNSSSSSNNSSSNNNNNNNNSITTSTTNKYDNSSSSSSSNTNNNNNNNSSSSSTAINHSTTTTTTNHSSSGSRSNKSIIVRQEQFVLLEGLKLKALALVKTVTSESVSQY